MDISLGKKYSSVEFDYDAFQKECDTQNFPLTTASELTIWLKDTRVSQTHGQFDSENQQLFIHSKSNINNYLRHELAHISEWHKRNRTVDTAYNTYYRGSTAALYAGVAAIALTAADRTLNLGLNNELLARADYGILAGMLALQLGYIFHPEERKARKEANRYGAQIFTVRPN